jgi:hypothetical protein
MDLASGARSLLASQTDSLACLGVVAALGCTYCDSIQFGDRPETGFSYVFTGWGPGCVQAAPSDTDPRILILLDTDRDGIIDSFKQLSGTQWMAEGWFRLESYREWWLP